MSFITISLDASEIEATKKALGQLFDNAGLTATLKAALEKAVVPARKRLEELSPVGPTGNLKRAVSSKVVGYPKNGGAVGLVGYRQSQKEKGTALAGPGSVRIGKERGFHQWWLEFGTKARVLETVANKPYGRRGHLRRVPGKPAVDVRPHLVKAGQGAVIASSWSSRGAFSIDDGGTKSMPYAFFKKAKKGQALRLDPVPQGGVSGVPPLRTAYEQTRGLMGEILSRELSISLEAAIAKVARSTSGTLTGAVIQAGG